MDKCDYCKKEKMILITCRCDKKFCIKHKNENNHNCSYDYKKHGKEEMSSRIIKFNNKLNTI